MDILAARKKAAELAAAGKVPAGSEPAVPAKEEIVPPTADKLADAVVAEPAASGPAGDGTAASLAAVPAEGVAPEPASVAVAEAHEPQQEHELEMLAFRLGNEEYVVPVELVGEVLTPREITPVPHVPSYIVGVCSLRGMVLPIIDLKRRLGLAESVRDDKSRIIVAMLGPDDRVGLLVDRVRGVVRILPSSVRPAPETVDQGEGAAFLRGIARKDDRLYIILDVEKTAGT